MCLTLVASLSTSASAICLRAERREWEESTAKMKLRMSSMMAINRYYPGEAQAKSVKSISPVPVYPPGYMMTDPMATIPSNYPTSISRYKTNEINKNQ